MTARPGIAELVLAAAPPPRSRGGIALALALFAHAGLGVVILGSQPTLEAWSADVAARVHDELTRLELADFEEAPRVEPERAPEPPPAPAEAATAAASEAPPQGPAPPPRSPPARAGRVVAAPPGALDLTGDVVVTGQASTYAGGATAPQGTSDRPVPKASSEPGPAAPSPEPRPAPEGPPRRDRSRAVALAADEWNCPWPDAAESLALDEQVAVIRVVVGPGGSVESAEIVEDPGDGFGAAALACARRTRFTPALDGEGRAIRARSPAIRVHFYRER